MFVPWHFHMRPVRDFTGHADITLRIINASSKSDGVVVGGGKGGYSNSEINNLT